MSERSERLKRFGSGHQAHRHDVVIGTPWAYETGFAMYSNDPSSVVRNAVHKGLIKPKARVVDLGCGKLPRNAFYLADRQECTVDGVDLEEPDRPSGMPLQVARRLTFHQMPVMDFPLEPETYDAAVLARLIQYLSPDELAVLMPRLGSALRDESVVALNYTAEGGILSRQSEYRVDMYAHPVDEVALLLESSGFDILSLEPGATTSTNVPHAGTPAVTYDILAQKAA